MASPQGGFQAEIGRKSPSPMPRLRSSIQRHEPRHIAARQIAHIVERRRVGQRVKCARLGIVQPHFAIIAQIFGMHRIRSEEHTSELQSLMRISYAVFCLKKKTLTNQKPIHNNTTSKLKH